MTDLELQFPQQVEHRLGRGLLLRRRSRCGQHHQVDVAVRRHLAAAGAAERDQRQRVGRRAPGGMFVGKADDLVVKEGSRVRRRPAVARISGKPPRDLLPAALEGVAEDCGGIGPAGAGRAARQLSAGR